MIGSSKYFIHSNIQKDIYGNQSLAFCNICCRGLHISDNIEVPNIFSFLIFSFTVIFVNQFNWMNNSIVIHPP